MPPAKHAEAPAGQAEGGAGQAEGRRRGPQREAGLKVVDRGEGDVGCNVRARIIA